MMARHNTWILFSVLLLLSCLERSSGRTLEHSSKTKKVGNLAACLAACAKGTVAIQAFCRSIPLPQIRAACWAVQFAGPVACDGFCYMYFGGGVVAAQDMGENGRIPEAP